MNEFVTDAVKKIKKIAKIFLALEYKDGKRYFVFKPIHLGIPVNVNRRFSEKYGNLPIVQNKIVFDNYMGRGFGCNPKYILEEIVRRKLDYDIIWVLSEREEFGNEQVPNLKIVKYNSDEALKEYATAKIWVSNYHKIDYVQRGLQKKEDQYFIQTWHGSFGIKKIENDVALLKDNESWLRCAKLSSAMTDYWISGSAFETDVYKNAFWDVREVLEYGHPRNDIFFGNNENIKDKVYDILKINKNKKYFLYVPTFREDLRTGCYDLQFENIKSVLHDRFGGEWEAVVRLHPRTRKSAADIMGSCIIDATYYEDIQELLVCAGVVVTDYSSCIFDFMLSGRPAFIYAPDRKSYEEERGFYYSLSKTPFQIAETNEELLYNIENFDEKQYNASVEVFLADKGSVEDGHASERVVELIKQLMEKES